MKLVNLHEEIPKNNEDKISQSQIFLRKTDKTIRFSYANTISELKNPENKKVNISYGNNLNRNSSQ